MSRQPIQIHVYLYRMNMKGDYEFAIFQRIENPLWWQGVCGGLEDDETIVQGARREIYEETGIRDLLPLYRLDSISYLPANIFSDQAQLIWGKEVVVIPMYFFAMPYGGSIKLSDEHRDCRWLPFDEAEKLVYFHDQKTALWEVKERLLRGNLIR
jgi:dihydroneopterin triphosphate diphosphatase